MEKHIKYLIIKGLFTKTKIKTTIFFILLINLNKPELDVCYTII